MKTARILIVTVSLSALIGAAVFAQGYQQGDNSQNGGTFGQQGAVQQAPPGGFGGGGFGGPGGMAAMRGMGRTQLTHLQGSLVPNQMTLDMLSTQLGMTDTQKQQVSVLMSDYSTVSKPIIDARTAAVTSFTTEFGQDSPDQTKLTTASDKVAKADKDLIAAETTFWIGYKKLLSSTQMTQFNTQAQRMFQGGGGGMMGPNGRGRGRRGGFGAPPGMPPMTPGAGAPGDTNAPAAPAPGN
jgi:hypothetical protein